MASKGKRQIKVGQYFLEKPSLVFPIVNGKRAALEVIYLHEDGILIKIWEYQEFTKHWFSYLAVSNEATLRANWSFSSKTKFLKHKILHGF